MTTRNGSRHPLLGGGRRNSRTRDEIARDRAIEAILDRRASGHKVPRIAGDLRLGPQFVRDTIANARARGDRRALTDQQAAVACATLARGARVARQVEIPADLAITTDPAEPRAPMSAPGLDAPPALRLAYAEHLRALAADYAHHPSASAGLAHLADLWMHCQTGYPAKPIRSSGRAVMYAPVSSGSGGGSPAYACTVA